MTACFSNSLPNKLFEEQDQRKLKKCIHFLPRILAKVRIPHKPQNTTKALINKYHLKTLQGIYSFIFEF